MTCPDPPGRRSPQAKPLLWGTPHQVSARIRPVEIPGAVSEITCHRRGITQLMIIATRPWLNQYRWLAPK